MTLNLIKLQSVPIWEQLKIEEALLRADDRNWCLINSGSPDAIVMGISGKPEKLINQTLYTQNPVPLIKRFSGGGTVYIDQDTYFITLIFNSQGLPHFPQEILKWTETLYQPVFPSLNFQVRENDYVSGNKKFGGNAQYICKNRWLHHSSLLWDYDPNKMNILLLPQRRPEYRQDRSHGDFLFPLKEFMTKEELNKNLIDQLNQRFTLVESSLDEVASILEKPFRQSTQQIFKY